MSRLLGDVRRGTPRRRRFRRSASPNFFAGGTLVRPRGRSRRGNNRGEPADTASFLNYFAAIDLRRNREKTATGYVTEATFPERHLVGLFRACLHFFPRVVNSTERITELGQLTRALVQFLRHPWRLLGAIGRFRRSGNQGGSAQTEWSPNHIAATDLRAAGTKKVQPGKYHKSRPRVGAWFKCFGPVGAFSGRVAKYPGKLTEAALPTWHPDQFICCCRYFLRVRGDFRRENNLGNNAKLAHRAYCWSAPDPFLMRGQLRHETNNDKPRKGGTSLTGRAGVGFAPPARRRTPGNSTTALLLT